MVRSLLLDEYCVDDIYDLRTWDDGYCHTFNPEQKQDKGFNSRLGLFLGHQIFNSNNLKFNFKSFSLFIHERGQFWPKSQMENQVNFLINPDRSTVLSFTLVSQTKLGDENNFCIHDESYSLTKCLHHFILNKVGCALNWFQPIGQPTCSSKHELLKTQEVLEWIQISSLANISHVTGRFLKCKTNKYSVVTIKDEEKTWATDWISEVYIQPNSAPRQELLEYLSYDLGDLLGDLGGYLGLFLGWSLLSLTLYIPTILKHISVAFNLWRNK